MNERQPNVKALLPILVFLVLYLGSGIYFEYIRPEEGRMGFYVISVVVAFGLALIVAFAQNRTLSFDEKIHLCARGIGDDNIVIMLFIFLMAGAFSGLASAAGGALSTANLMLDIIPPAFALPGLFVIACLISMSMGTSVGTITVLVPIAVEISKNTGLAAPLVIGAVIGGFILLLVNPVYAVMFIAITLILQVCDGYIIKPKLFGNSLGVSGLLILIAIVTMGNAFGIGGILLAIPVAAICDFSYREGVLPCLQRRKAKKQAAAGSAQGNVRRQGSGH